MSFPNVPSSTASVTIPNREDGWAPGPRDISVTPSGQHMWAMTPGGTKLMWTRDQLMHLSHSPLRAPVPEDHCEDNDSDGETGQTTTTTVQNGTEDDVFVMDS